MKALSIRQPWAEAIVGRGQDVVNSSWPTTFRGPVLIHASQLVDDPGFAVMRQILERLGKYPCQGIHPDDLRRGGIVGRAEIVDCVTSSPSPWFTGPHGFVLRNARPLIFRECNGSIGFFDVDPGILDLDGPPPVREPGHPDLFAGDP